MPTDEKFPFLLDCATSITQRGKIEVYAKLGKKIIRYPLSAVLRWVESRMVTLERRPRRGRPPKAIQVARERDRRSASYQDKQ